jgi:photosystem II stability/assembly factor-like uncharacterized protein
MNGTTFNDCAGQIVIPQHATSTPPTIYCACIAGMATGLWKSTNGGVDWTTLNVVPAGSFQQFYAPWIDPYDDSHMLIVPHTKDAIFESDDGGSTWTAVPMDSGMQHGGGATGNMYFVDTGDPTTTRQTWMWISAPTGGTVGTWRTTNGGGVWTRVDQNEHTTGSTQVFWQPDTSGVMFMVGVYSALGWGVLRSMDYGKTWAHVGQGNQEATVFGTEKNVYAMFGWAPGPMMMVNPNLEVAPMPGTGTWSSPPVPSTMSQGPGQAVVTSDGTHSIIVVSSYNAGLWRYVEP